MRRDIVVQRYFLSRRKKRVINITNVIKLNFKSPSFEIIINRQRKRAFAILTENLKLETTRLSSSILSPETCIYHPE